MVGIFQKLLLFDCRITLYNSCVYFPLSPGVISFGVCYYYGPVTSDRGLDLIRWMLQLIGLSLLYMSTRSDEVSIALCITVVWSHIIRFRLLNTGKATFHAAKIKL